jgi:hypothetical protein
VHDRIEIVRGHHDWNSRPGRGLQRLQGPGHDDDIDLGPDHLGRVGRQCRRRLGGWPQVDGQILTFDEVQLVKLIQEPAIRRLHDGIGRAREHADAIDPSDLLCARRKRPRCRCATQNTKKFPPPHVRPWS